MSQSTTMHGSKGIMDINRALNILFPHGIDEQSGLVKGDLSSQKILWVCATSQYILSIPKDFFNKDEFDLIHGVKDCSKKVTGDLERIIEGAKATSELAEILKSDGSLYGALVLTIYSNFKSFKSRVPTETDINVLWENVKCKLTGVIEGAAGRELSSPAAGMGSQIDDSLNFSTIF